MASHCENCGRGAVIGHNVSHAKNRTRRLFKPNLQSLRALKNGILLHVVLCTRCIQRLKKFGQVGNYFKFQYASVPSAAGPAKSVVPSHKHIDREKKKIEEIMKKEEVKWKEKAEEEKATVEKKKKEKIRIEELVGKK